MVQEQRSVQEKGFDHKRNHLPSRGFGWELELCDRSALTTQSIYNKCWRQKSVQSYNINGFISRLITTQIH